MKRGWAVGILFVSFSFIHGRERDGPQANDTLYSSTKLMNQDMGGLNADA